MKRIVDIIGSAIGLLILFPIIFLCALAIMKEDGMPVFYKQRRLGRNGKPFMMYKIRSMVKNAEAVLKANPALYEEYKKNYKLDNDPRILKCGQFLRATSLDELPQLINVLKGEMSLVGPRPIVESELEKFEGETAWYQEMKPGCAGVWQCSGRNDVGYPEVVEFDREYHEKADFWFDLKIMYLTAVSIITRRGAK